MHKSDVKIFVLKLRLTLAFLLDLEDQFIKKYSNTVTLLAWIHFHSAYASWLGAFALKNQTTYHK